MVLHQDSKIATVVSVIACLAMIITILTKRRGVSLSKLTMLTFSASIAYVLLVVDAVFISMSQGNLHDTVAPIAWACNDVFWKIALALVIAERISICNTKLKSH